MTPTTADERHDLWLAWRREGIGGSDVAAIAGLSPWATPMTVWLDKTGQLPDEDSAAMRWGRRLETAVADEFEHETGLHVIGRQDAVHDPDHPWRRVTLDGLVAESPNSWPGDALGVYEGKTTSDRIGDEPPEHYQLQVQYQMAVTGRDRAWVATLHGDRGFRLAIHELERDPAIVDAVCGLVDDFWHDYVLTGTPPPIDGSAVTTRAISLALAQSDPGTATTRDDLADLVDELRLARERQKALDAEVAEMENTIRLALGDAETLLVDGTVAVTWKTSTSQRLDTKTLEQDHPDLVAAYRRPSTSRRFLLKKAPTGG